MLTVVEHHQRGCPICILDDQIGQLPANPWQKELGADPEDVIRTRTFLKRREDWEAASNVHGEFFGDIRPASTMLAVDSMIDPDWLVETELEAVLGKV